MKIWQILLGCFLILFVLGTVTSEQTFLERRHKSDVETKPVENFAENEDEEDGEDLLNTIINED